METKVNRKPRSAPHVWKRVWKLRPYDNFYLGKTLFGYSGFFCIATGPSGIFKFVAPWRRVRTTELIKPLETIPYKQPQLPTPPDNLEKWSGVRVHVPRPFNAKDYQGECEAFNCSRAETADPTPSPQSYGPSC